MIAVTTPQQKGGLHLFASHKVAPSSGMIHVFKPAAKVAEGAKILHVVRFTDMG
jgi:hypothetical protein